MVAAGNSVAILFIDLSEAFHRLVRELVTGVTDAQAVQVILDTVGDSGISPAGLQQWLKVPGLLRRLGCSPVLERLLQDIHQYTWFCLQGHDGLSRTRRGTRPGSPLADIIFHVLMADCLIELNAWIQSDQINPTPTSSLIWASVLIPSAGRMIWRSHGLQSKLQISLQQCSDSWAL